MMNMCSFVYSVIVAYLGEEGVSDLSIVNDLISLDRYITRLSTGPGPGLVQHDRRVR